MSIPVRTFPASLIEAYRETPHAPPGEGYRPEEGAERRRQLRWPVFWDATLSDGEQSIACTVMDFSPSGARVKLSERARFEMPMALLSFTNGMQLAGTVAWQRGGICGIAFSANQPQVKELAGQELAA